MMKFFQLGTAAILISFFSCNTVRKKNDDASQSKYTGLVGSCSVSKSDLQINLCLEYSYSTVATNDPKQDAISKLQSSCEQASTQGKWNTNATCFVTQGAWICNASSQDGNDVAILKMVIRGTGATQDNAKKLCDSYKGTLTTAQTSQTAMSICSRDQGNGYISYEIAAPSTSTVKRWFIKNGNAVHDSFDTHAAYDTSVARWTDSFYLNNMSTDDSVVYEVDGKQIASTVKNLVANRCP